MFTTSMSRCPTACYDRLSPHHICDFNLFRFYPIKYATLRYACKVEIQLAVRSARDRGPITLTYVTPQSKLIPFVQTPLIKNEYNSWTSVRVGYEPLEVRLTVNFGASCRGGASERWPKNVGRFTFFGAVGGYLYLAKFLCELVIHPACDSVQSYSTTETV